MTKVRPRSLLQVVLMGFVLVLMPLGGMIWHDSQALEHLSQLTSDELERAVRLLARGEDPQKVIEALSHGLTNKFLHAPTRFLSASEGDQRGDCADLVQRIFNLHKEH